jgi:hypothetical protein
MHEGINLYPMCLCISSIIKKNMQKLNRPKHISKQSNKQSLVQPDKASLMESPSYCDVHDVEWQICLLRMVKGFFFTYNHNLMIIKFMSRHLVLWSLKNLKVCESLGKGTTCAREKYITPSAPYLR